MNNPFDPTHIQEARAEREAKRLKLRTNLLIALFCAVLLGFFAVLYQAQVVNGASYRGSSNYRIPQTEQVNSVRGELLDRYGRVLVSNEVGYNVELDTAAMGERRNETLERLLELCQEEGVSWSDSLPISTSAPWTFTTASPYSYQGENQDGEPETRPTWLGRLAKHYNWLNENNPEPSAMDLLAAMCKTFGMDLDGRYPTPADRALAGVLYELYLRANNINQSVYTFARGVDITFISRVKENALPGVKIETVTTRRYNTAYAAHVLGRVAAIDPDELPTYLELGYPMNAYVGKEGVERAFESHLHGTNGVRLIEKDQNGNISSQEWRTKPEPGNNVMLTLDLSLQATVEDLLSDYADNLGEDGGGMAAVAVDMTGGVLAMASYPTYNLSTYAQDIAELSADTKRRPLLNRATLGLYAPGSTFKMLTAVAGLSEGIIDTRSTVECTGLYYFYPDVHPPCWIWNSVGGRHGTENVTRAITDSCNIFFYDVGRRLGITTLGNYAAQFGLGVPTGIEIGEYKGFMAGPETSEYFGQTWFGGATMYAAIGQENNQFTPLQIANYVATLVNGGSHYQAHLLKEVKSSDYSQVVYEQEPVLLNTIDIAPEDLAAVKLGMYNLAQTASMARYFSSLPVTVGCKTGTAQVATKTANAVFVCFAPYDDPQIAICLVAEQGADGGSLARVAAGILAQYFSTEHSMNGVIGENTLLR